MAGNIVAFTTADADIASSTYMLDGINFPTYLHGLIDGDVTTAQSADLSKGNGFLAAAIEGGFSILDANGLIAKDIAGGHVNPIGWDIWLGYIPAGGTYIDIVNLGQLQSVDLKVADGKIQVVAKSPAYLGNQPLYGIRTATQLDTDPNDVTAPTNPAYLKTSIISQFAGIALGSREVSLKASEPLPVETLAHWKSTQRQTGDISSITNTIAYEVGYLFDEFKTTTVDGNGNTIIGAGLFFTCRVSDPLQAYQPSVDTTECARFCNLLNTFISAGYKIILSNGSWSMDTSLATFNGEIDFPANGFHINSGGLPFGYVGIPKLGSNPPFAFGAVWFNLCDSAGIKLYPGEEIDPSQIKVYAVGKSVSIAAQQVLIDGFAINDKTKSAAFYQDFDGTVLTINPASSTLNGFYLCEAIQTLLNVDVGAASGWAHRYGATSWNRALSANTVSGSTQNVNMDPKGTPSTSPLTISGNAVATSSDTTLDVKLYLQFPEISGAEIYCVDISYQLAAAVTSTPTNSPTLRAHVKSSYWPPSAPDYYSVTTASHSASISKTIKAKSVLAHPIWSRAITSTNLSDLKPDQAFLESYMWSSDTGQISLSLNLSEMFIWAFSQVGFSELYSTIFPFWTRGDCSNLAADGTGNVMAAGAGIGATSADGAINWSTLTLPQRGTGGAYYQGQAFGASSWVSVGVFVSNGVSVPSFWTLAGGTWTAGVFSGIAYPTRIRYLGTHFVTMFEDGTIQTSTDGITWASPVAASPSAIYDMAFDGTNYVAVGRSGYIEKSTNLTAWTPVTASGITGLVYGIAWLASGSGGAIYVAGGAGGKAYYANQTQALAGTWTAVALGSGPDSIDAIGVTATGSNAVLSGQTTTGFKIWSTGDGVSYGVAFSDTDDSMGGIQGYGSGVVYTTNGWVVGTESGNIITSIQGGQPVPSTWIPWGASNPKQALTNLRGRYFGGLRRLIYGGDAKQWNPVQWTGGKYFPNLQTWGIAFDPPTSTVNDYSGTNADAAARKIAGEWWAFAGEMPSTVLDGSNDSIEEHFPELALGNIEDVATIITVQYQPFGGKYLGAAYIQNVNVDRATAGKPDAFFFAGWDIAGNTNGLALWTLCRNVFLETGILRATSLTFDSIHDADTLGFLWTTVDPDLGTRMRWLCDRPRYLKLIVNGNDSKAAQAQCGCRYKPNTAMLDGRQMPALNSTGYGVVVQADHNYTQGTHVLDIAFPPA